MKLHDNLMIKKDMQILNQKRGVDFIFMLDLQMGFADITTLELQKGLDKDTKNFRRINKRSMRKHVLKTSFEKYKDNWEK